MFRERELVCHIPQTVVQVGQIGQALESETLQEYARVGQTELFIAQVMVVQHMILRVRMIADHRGKMSLSGRGEQSDIYFCSPETKS